MEGEVEKFGIPHFLQHLARGFGFPLRQEVALRRNRQFPTQTIGPERRKSDRQSIFGTKNRGRGVQTGGIKFFWWVQKISEKIEGFLKQVTKK